MKVKHLFIGALVALIIFGCLPYEEEIAEIDLNIKDPALQRLLDYQDRQEVDSIYPYFHHEDATFRYAAAMAFASIAQPEYTDTLSFLLQSKNDLVRAAAAFAIGQCGGDKAEKLLLDRFERYDTIGYYKRSNRAILEAIGKCGSEPLLEALSTISTYNEQDTALLEGQALGIYRYALRGNTSFAGTSRMVELATGEQYPSSVRLIAANYLSRANGIKLDTFAVRLTTTTKSEPDPNIRMALVIAMGKTQRPGALEALISLFDSERDHRVKGNILRAFGNFDYARTQALVNAALKDPNPNIALRAAQFFVDYGIPEDAISYRRTARDTLPTKVQILMYQAANRHLPNYYADTRGLINYDLRRKFEQSFDPYEKALAMRALAEFPWNYRYIHDAGFRDSSFIVKTSAVDALAAISSRPDFDRFFGTGKRVVSRELARYFQEAVATADPGMVSGAATPLRDKNRDYRSFLDSLDFLDKALAKLRLPGEVEAYRALKQTIDVFAGNEYQPYQVPHNHPIDWQAFNNLSDDPKAVIRTSKGTIILEFYLQEAPATAINFIKLARAKYFDGKNFHRVVPNFVIQGGCSRGDGYGGLDYTIRSEISQLSYNDEGFVGMASAGPHTEGTQFFITHSPALHLDGKFSIFAKVTKNTMDVVHQIEAGDLIESVSFR